MQPFKSLCTKTNNMLKPNFIMFSDIRDRKYLRYEFNFVSKQIYRYACAFIQTYIRD